ncbi:hypothetical protein BDV06DRAFT_234399 [Aspergillus oleicola]
MGQADRDISKNRTSDSFRTPDKPVQPSKSKRASASARLSSLALADTSGAAPASTSILSTASRSKSRSTKRIPTRDQPTLTQIDFVTRSQQPDSDDDSPFEYIGDSEGDTRELIEIEDKSEDDDDDEKQDNDQDLDYKPSSTSRIKRERGVRSNAVPSKPKRSSSGIQGTSGTGRRKSGDKKDKGKAAQKDDKTLTQMKYVQRINIEPNDDEDAKLEYVYITSKKKDSERQTNNDFKTEDHQKQSYISQPTSQHKRRKLSPNPAGNKVHEAGPKSEGNDMRPPTTPRKTFKHEIPSSQSPETPSIAFITSSQFRSATRSPEKPAFRVPNKPFIKTEAPGSPELKGTPRTVHSPHSDRNPPRSSPNRQVQAGFMPDVKASTEVVDDASTEALNAKELPKPTQRTVVYETDAESDYSEFDDDPPDVPSSPGAKQDTTDSQQGIHVEPELHSSKVEPEPEPESQELPPLPILGTQIESGSLPSQLNLLSDASICYQRLHPDTQFPLDPVPTINTQKMAELFPENSHGLHTITPSPSSSPSKPRSHPEATPQVVTETQDPDQTQDRPESQTDKTPTEIVPESSPVACREDSGGAGTDTNPRIPRDVVVQVESSQPADRAYRQQMSTEDSGPRKMLSRSQILTSSVMESIPIPAFWMSSQDSVMEPYPLPDS